jgi:prevent-host-death family protein
MINIQEGIRSLTEFKQNSTEILNYIKRTHTPTILTVNGRTEAVLLDAKSYQEMVDKIEMMESARKIEAALVEMENSKGIPAKEAFKKIRKELEQKIKSNKKTKK